VWTLLIASAHFTNSNFEQFVALLPHFIGASCCYCFSALYHLSFGISEESLDFYAKLDYFGIAAVIWGSTVSMTWLLFRCDGGGGMYIFVSCFAAVLVGILCLDERFAVPAYRFYRALSFTLQLSMLGLPYAHASFRSPSPFELQPIHANMFGMLSSVSMCVAFFSSRFPERFQPGSFDLFGNSHHFLHLLVLAAIYFFYRALDEATIASYAMCPGDGP
jgi:adiponectin receptor